MKMAMAVMKEAYMLACSIIVVGRSYGSGKDVRSHAGRTYGDAILEACEISGMDAILQRDYAIVCDA